MSKHKIPNLPIFGGMEGAISAQPSLTSLHVADELIGGKNLCDKRFGRLIAVDPYCVKGKHYKTKWICICDCGDETVVDARNLVNGPTRSCGCLLTEMMKGRSGSNSPRWIHDRASMKDRHRIYEYERWRTAVYERDLYTCRKCGETGQRLNAHHLDGYADNPDKRFDVENGRTLCRSCHKEFHRQYGILHSTRSQYEEWANKTEEE